MTTSTSTELTSVIQRTTELLAEHERFPSWNHQREAFAHLLQRGRSGAYLDMAMGTGKSKVVIDYVSTVARQMTTLHRARRDLRVLILCPKSVVPVWPDQISQHAHDDLDAEIVAPPGGSVAKRSEIIGEALTRNAGQRATIVVVNYEGARSHPLGYEKRRRLDGLLLSTRWDIVIFDEAHRAKRPSGATHLFTRRLHSVSDRRVCLSGTPWPNGPHEAWGQYRFLDRAVFDRSFTTHRRQYCQLGGPGKNWITGVRNLDEFARRVRHTVYHCGDDVVDLPELTIVDRRFDLDSKERTAYKAMEKDFIAWVKSAEYSADNILTRLLRLAQITSGFVQDGETVASIGSSRSKALADFLDDISPDEPVVVFCRFRQEIEDVTKILAARRGVEPDEISGTRKTVGAKWDGATGGLVAQIRSGSLGIDLTAARYAIMYAPTFSLSDYEQAIKRIHRPGQGRPCSIVRLVAECTVDGTTYGALQDKQRVVDTIVRGIQGAE